MRYYGNKTKLLPFIEEVVKQTGINGKSKFVDLFSGTSSVGMHFKKLGYTVYSNDNLEFAYAFSKTFIELNSLPKFVRLVKELRIRNGVEGIFNFLNGLDELKEGFITKNYSPKGGRKYFSTENAMRIDTIRELIHDWRNSNLINEDEYYYLITSLLKAINLVSNVSGTYAAYLKTWDKRALNKITLSQPQVINSERKNKAFKADANDIIENIKSDILYLDPPYNNRQYASNYFILELVAEGWFEKKPNIYGKTGMREYDHQKSKYCSSNTALKSLEDLLAKAKSEYILLSYNNEGLINKNLLEDVLSKFGDVNVYTEKHKRYRSINQTVEDTQLTFENIFIVKPRNIKNNINSLSGKEWLQNSFSIWRDLGKNEEERKLKHPAIFTIKLISKLIDTFCKPEGGLVMDCFAGSGTTLIAGLIKEKDVIGFDLSSEYKSLFIKRATQYYNVNTYGLGSKYIVTDSRRLSEKINSNSVDLCITSPPYWDILNRQRTADNKENKNYSDKIEDLGNIVVYNEFVSSLKSVCEEVYKVTKPKGYFIINVMDLRKKDKFFPLHIDTARIAQEAGFSFEDIFIWDRQPEYNNMRPLGYPFKFIVNKVHEYLLIFRKLEK